MSTTKLSSAHIGASHNATANLGDVAGAKSRGLGRDLNVENVLENVDGERRRVDGERRRGASEDALASTIAMLVLEGDEQTSSVVPCTYSLFVCVCFCA
jgi:hypothetical protein